MPRILRITLVLATFLAPGVSQAQPMAEGYYTTARATSDPKPIDECQLIARVDGEVILSCELLWQVNLRFEEIGDRVPPEHRDQVRQQLMQQLLMETLDLRMLYADFQRGTNGAADMDGIRKSLAEPFEESEVPRLMKMVGVKERHQLEPRLLELGTSLRERREDFVKSSIARQWIQQALDYDKEVTHQQMLDYYRANTEKYEFPTQAKWEELMVSFDRYPSEADAYRDLAIMGNEAFKLARQSPPDKPVFTEIAKQRSHGFTASEGGLQDWTTQGALAAETLDQALFLLPPGQTSGILRSDRGFHIVRVLERKQAGRTPFTEVQADIRKAIQDQRFGKAINAKLADLKSKAHVWTVFTGNLKRDKTEVAERRGEEAMR